MTNVGEEEIIAAADKLGDRVGAFVRAHVGQWPTAAGIGIAWALGAYGPKWVGFVVGAIVVALAVLAAWAAGHEANKTP
jgi:hypothetical protein